MKTIQDLKDIKNQKGAQVDIRFGGDAEAEKTYILCCAGTGCTSSHS